MTSTVPILNDSCISGLATAFLTQGVMATQDFPSLIFRKRLNKYDSRAKLIDLLRHLFVVHVHVCLKDG